MARLTVETLGTLREEYVLKMDPESKTRLLVCGGTGCHATGSLKLIPALREEIEAKGLGDKVKVVETGCNGFCAAGPIMVIQPGGIFYQKLKVDDVPELVESHLINNKPVERLWFKDPVTKKKIGELDQIPFFSNQMSRALRNKGVIDPEVIEEYIARHGYEGVAKALFDMTADDIIEEMKKSGLRGRGGAGFPAGLKWQFAKASPGEEKFVLCNADEGDPGAFMDRSILEADPNAVLEGMTIAAKAIGAKKGYIYART